MNMTMIYISHIVNVVILMPLCILILLDKPRMSIVLGPDSTARQILVCMYLTILILSTLALLLKPYVVFLAFAVFPMQIIYKTLSLFLIKNKRLPVYWFNLGVTVLHVVTLSMNVALFKP